MIFFTEVHPAKPHDLIRPAIRAMTTYAVPDATGLIKLDAMESPYGVPADLQAAWLDALRDTPLNRYPDPQGLAVKQQLRTAFAIPDDLDILLGNGSDELILLILMAVAEPGRVVLAPEPTFVMYRHIAQAVGMTYVGVPLDDQFGLNHKATQEAITHHQPAVIFIASPNNPTGRCVTDTELEAVSRAAPGLVVIDEAYFAFKGETHGSVLDSIAQLPNVLVMRTLSKLGLAGLRLGWLMGPAAWLTELEKIRLPYNINVLTQRSTAFALHHYARLKEQIRQICEMRDGLYHALDQLPSFTAYPSLANFLLLRSRIRPADAVFQRLLSNGILVKNVSHHHPLLEGCLRITVGTPQENQALLRALHSLA